MALYESSLAFEVIFICLGEHKLTKLWPCSACAGWRVQAWLWQGVLIRRIQCKYICSDEVCKAARPGRAGSGHLCFPPKPILPPCICWLGQTTAWCCFSSCAFVPAVFCLSSFDYAKKELSSVGKPNSQQCLKTTDGVIVWSFANPDSNMSSGCSAEVPL